MAGKDIYIRNLASPLLDLHLVVGNAKDIAALADVEQQYLYFIQKQLGSEVDEISNIAFSAEPVSFKIIKFVTECQDKQIIYPVLLKKRGLWTSIALSNTKTYTCDKCESKVSVTKLYVHPKLNGTNVVNAIYYCIDCTPSKAWVSEQACRRCGRYAHPYIKTMGTHVCMLECDDCDKVKCYVCSKKLTLKVQNENACKCRQIFYCSNKCGDQDKARHEKDCVPQILP